MNRIFVTTAINFVKKRKSSSLLISLQEELPDMAQEEEPEGPPIPDLNPEEALALVNELPEKYRLIINMYVVDKLSHEEIAAQLGVSGNEQIAVVARP